MNCRANLRRSLRDLADDLECASSDLTVAIDRVIPGADIDAIVIREEGEPTTIDMGELRRLVDGLDETSAEIDSAVDDFNWRVAQALKAFKQQILTSETTP